MAHRASARFDSQPLNPMGRRQALSEHHRVLSVRTERLPVGLLHVGEPPLSFQGLTGSQYHLTRNVCWPAKKLLRLREWCARPLSNLKVAWGAGSLGQDLAK
jgi:hypothetical protein